MSNGGPTWEGSMNQPGAFRGCPESSMDRADFVDENPQTRSTFAGSDFANDATPDYLISGTGEYLVSGDEKFVAQPFENDLRYAGQASTAAFEAYRVYLRNEGEEGGGSGRVNIQVRKSKDDGTCCGEVLSNKQGDKARWVLEVMEQDSNSPFLTNEYYEIIVDTCMFFDPDVGDTEIKENRYFLVISHHNDGSQPITWLRTPMNFNLYYWVCNPNWYPTIIQNVSDDDDEVWDGITVDGECGEPPEFGVRPMALSIDAEYIFKAAPQVDINLDGRTGITDLLSLAWYIKDSENYGLTPSQLNMSDLSEPLGTYDLNDINAIEDIILEYSYQYTAPIYTSLWKRPDLNYNSLFNNQSKYDDKSFWDSTENTFVQWEDITDATPNYTAEVLPDASFEWIYNYLQGNVCDGGNASVEIGMPCGEIGNDSLECGGPGGNCISYADPAHVNLFGPQSFADYMPEYVYFIYYGKSG